MNFKILLVFVFYLFAFSREYFAETIKKEVAENSKEEPNIENKSIPSHNIGYGFNLQFKQVRDEIFLPIRWMGPALDISFLYEHKTKHSIHNAYFSLPFAILFDRYTNIAVNSGIKTGYSYHHKFNLLTQWGSFFGGFQFRQNVDIYMYPHWDDSHLYWVTVYDLGPGVLYELKHYNHLLKVKFSFPLIGLASRPKVVRENKIDKITHISNYFIQPHRNSTFVFPFNYTAFDLTLVYEIPLKNQILIPEYTLHYLTIREPKRISVLTHEFYLKVMYEI